MKEVFVFLGFAISAWLICIFLNRVIAPWRSRRWLAKTVQKIREGKLKPPHFDVAVAWDADGFWVRDGKAENSPPRLAWGDITKIVAFKRDLFSTDRICLFLSKSDGSGLEVHEEMNDWMTFAQALPTHLANCKPADAWLWDITTPAFATNLTEIYSRTTAASQNGGSP